MQLKHSSLHKSVPSGANANPRATACSTEASHSASQAGSSKTEQANQQPTCRCFQPVFHFFLQFSDNSQSVNSVNGDRGRCLHALLSGICKSITTKGGL